MALRRVFTNPDGSVRILVPNRKLYQNPTTQDLDRLVQETKDSTLAGLPFVDLDESELPANRMERHKWRLTRLDGASRVDADKGIA